MWLLVLDWLRRAWPALAVCLVVAVLCYSHHCSYERGKAECEAAWRQRAADQQTERLKELRDAERKAQAKQDAIVRDYTEEMELLRVFGGVSDDMNTWLKNSAQLVFEVDAEDIEG